MARRAAILGITLGLGLLARAARLPAVTWEEAEGGGLRFGAVVVEAADVFDPRLPDERHLVARAANAIHVTTRERVLRAALLFASGDRVEAARVRESERRLRALPWLIDAAIEPRPAGEGVVDALVRTHDGWSLSVGLKFNRAGGDDLWRVSVEEENLLGWGKALSVTRERGLERTSDEVAYRDPMVLGSRWRLEASLQDLSDGGGRRLKLERPFPELAAPWAAGVEVLDVDIDVTRYQAGTAVYGFPAALADARLFWRRRYRLAGRTAWRAGVEYLATRDRYGELAVVRPGVLPAPDLEPRRLAGVLGVWEVSQDRYAAFRDLRSVSATEDVNLGWDAILKAGRMARALGGDREAWYAEGFWHAGARIGGGGLLLHDGEARGRVEGERLRDALVKARQSLFWQGLPRQTLAASLGLAWSRRLDPEHALYLGGLEGMRGYPNRFRTGDRSWMVTLEDRVVTPWRLGGIVQAGFVAYADAGAIAAEGGGFGRTWIDAGAGLRLGNLKGTLTRVVQLTLAVPLVREEGVPRWQVVAGNTFQF